MLALYWLTGFYNDTLYKSRIQVLGNTAFNALAATIIFAMTAMLNDTMPMRRLNYELMACLTGAAADVCRLRTLDNCHPRRTAHLQARVDSASADYRRHKSRSRLCRPTRQLTQTNGI